MVLFDGNFIKKDKIGLWGSSKENPNFITKAVQFSPDDSIVVVATSDCII